MYDYRKFLKSLNIVVIIIIFISVFIFSSGSIFQNANGKPFTDYGSVFVCILLAGLFCAPFILYLDKPPYQENYATTIILVVNTFAALLLPLDLFSLITGHYFDGSPYTSSNYDFVMLLASSVAILNIFSLIKREK